MSKSNVAPPLPDNWDRCHAYNERKRRYCRQMPVPLSGHSHTDQPRYCGNHIHLMETGAPKKRPREKDRGRRVPCPIDPSHLIFESSVAKHVLICPAVKQQQEVSAKEYYCEGINLGGFGDMERLHPAKEAEISATYVHLEEAKQLAYAVLRVFHYLFLTPSTNEYSALTDQQLQNITELEIYNAIPEVDLSEVEDRRAFDQTEQKLSTGKLTNAITTHCIKGGGPRHIRQIASILGHLRQNDLIATDQIVEMGAGRGMTGLIVAGAAAASSSRKVNLHLIERAGTRAKAETKIRTADSSKNSKDDCLRLDLVDAARVKCDLAHVDMSKVLPLSNSMKTVVIAKHLCGAGTDLALKSLRNIQSIIDGCVMATCCHGLCTWTDYVGRNCLLRLFHSEVAGLSTSFGEKEFNLLRRWTSASVLEDNIKPDSTTNGDEVKKEHKVDSTEEDKGKYLKNITAVVKGAGLGCGPKGLGRACQRLIDHGRCEYMRKNLFSSANDSDSSSSDRSLKVTMRHYVSHDITPQNALIVAARH